MLHLEEAGKAASTRRNCYAALRGARDDAMVNGLIVTNPVSRVKRPKADHHEALSLRPQRGHPPARQCHRASLRRCAARGGPAGRPEMAGAVDRVEAGVGQSDPRSRCRATTPTRPGVAPGRPPRAAVSSWARAATASLCRRRSGFPAKMERVRSAAWSTSCGTATRHRPLAAGISRQASSLLTATRRRDRCSLSLPSPGLRWHPREVAAADVSWASRPGLRPASRHPPCPGQPASDTPGTATPVKLGGRPVRFRWTLYSISEARLRLLHG